MARPLVESMVGHLQHPAGKYQPGAGKRVHPEIPHEPEVGLFQFIIIVHDRFQIVSGIEGGIHPGGQRYRHAVGLFQLDGLDKSGNALFIESLGIRALELDIRGKPSLKTHLAFFLPGHFRPVFTRVFIHHELLRQYYLMILVISPAFRLTIRDKCRISWRRASWHGDFPGCPCSCPPRW